MPLLSLVLAVHGEQAYITDCAESILGQDFTDLELVAVDDASPGHAPALLDELAARDSRVVVKHLPSPVARGEARNIGLAAAQGTFVWFVNATDRLPAGSLARVAERLGETRADVLVLHHTVVDSMRRRRPGPFKQQLGKAAKGEAGPLSVHRSLADAAPAAWNKVFRRELLAGRRFGSGAHSELTVTWPAMLDAQRIAALPAASYERRTPGNVTPDDGSPFDVFVQYEQVLEHAGERRELVAPAMLRHLLTLLDRVPQGQRREFFHLMSGIVGGVPGHTAQLVEHDRYVSYQALQRSLELRKKLRTRASRQAGKRAKARLERHYRRQLKQPVDPNLAVFAAYWYRGYSCNPRAIYEKARELVPGMRGVWVVKAEGAASVPEGVEHVIEGTPEYYDAIARARYFVNNVNFPNHLVKRDGTVHVMTHHGTPLKKMGMDQRESPVSGARIDFAGLLRRCARWDLSVSSNPFSTLVWEHAYPVPFESLESGYPRNDVLANATDASVQEAREKLGIEGGRTVVLYAPTHREYESAFSPTLDLEQLAAQLGPDSLLLTRAHYFYDRPGRQAGDVRDVSGHPSVEELMLASDVLVTDYSSIMFDYGVLDRPIVSHVPDWEVYRALRGTYFDLMEQPPGPITRSVAEVAEAIRAGDPAPDRRAAFRARFCSLDDGRAAERVVRRVWFGERQPAANTEPVVVA
jgi:CDP-glycerol glycerophosphotransferase (TagB/SpsB family)